MTTTPTKEEMMTWTVEQFNEFSKQHKLRPLVETEADWWNGNGPFHDFREQMIEQYLAIVQGCYRRMIRNHGPIDFGSGNEDDDLPEPLPSTNWKPHLNLRTGMFELDAITTNTTGYTKRQPTKMVSYTIPKCESYNLDFDDDPQSVPMDRENVAVKE